VITVRPRLARLWSVLRRSHNWPYLALLVLIVGPLLWMAVSLAVHSGLFALSGPPQPNQVGVFLTFIGGGLATSVTLLGALLTREHNASERQRLRLETVIKSLETLPTDATPRVAGVLCTLLLLGQQRLAIRVLQPAWRDGSVDPGTATWLVGQVLLADPRRDGKPDGDRVDAAAVEEAAVLMLEHADQLTDRATGMYYFPGHFLTRWRTEHQLSTGVKEYLLLTIARMLAGQNRDWWCPGDDLPVWPTTVLLECAEHEPDEVVRGSAAVLVAALRECFPGQFAERLAAGRLAAIDRRAARAVAARTVPREVVAIADRIRAEWPEPSLMLGDDGGVDVLEAQRLAEPGRDDEGDAEQHAQHDDGEQAEAEGLAGRAGHSPGVRPGQGADAEGEQHRQPGAEGEAGEQDAPGAVEGESEVVHGQAPTGTRAGAGSGAATGSQSSLTFS
jgi:hypothetical protein